jgi:hypothetical protein
MTKIWIDPPSGWRYGFPAVFDTASGQPLQDWLVAKGYPESEVTWAMQYLRMWDWDPKLDPEQE